MVSTWENEIGMVYERKPAEEGGKAYSAGLTLETINKLGGPRFNDVRVRFERFGAETAIPQSPSIGMGITIEDLEILGGTEVLTRVIPYNRWITRSAR